MERVRDKNAVSFSVVISMLGGVFIIAGGLGLLGLLRWQGSTLMMGGGWHMFTIVYPYWLTAIIVGVSLSAGATIVAASYKMYKEPEKKFKLGLLIMIGSLVALFSVGGFGLGGVLGLIGGLMGMSRKS